MSSLIVLNSKNRNLSAPNTSTSNFTVNLGATVQCSSVMVKSVLLKNVVNNIDETNYIFTYSTDGVDRVSLPAITPGYYNIDELIALLEPLLDASVGGANTITQDANTGSLTFNYGASIITLDEADGNAMADVLGIIDSATVVSTTYLSTGVPELTGIDQLYVVSRSLTDGATVILSEGLRLPILTEVPIDVAFGGTQTYEANVGALNLIRHRSLNNIQEVDIQIVNRKGIIVDLKGTDVIVIVKIFSNKSPNI